MVGGMGTGTPTGTVEFWEVDPNTGATIALLSTTTVNTFGQAGFTTSSLSVGTHRIMAVYLGDTSFGGSSGTTNVTITGSIMMGP